MSYYDESEKKRRELESAGLPEDKTLPYFAYGFLNPINFHIHKLNIM